MASRTPRGTSASLKTSGGVILGCPDHYGTSGARSGMTTPRNLDDLSIRDMESALQGKLLRRPAPETVRTNDGAQTARGILEENKKLISEQQDRKTMARKNSREEFDKLVVQDRLTTERDKASSLNRRQAQRELASYYKERIGEKEQAKASEYSTKRDNGKETTYFPFVEGETIDKNRAAKSANMREEMREFLHHQREHRPPRPDAKTNDAAEPHTDLSLPTRFLTRAQPHMSRRLQDGHVRRALEEKVRTTKEELESAARQRHIERQQWEEGLLVNDALRYDKDQANRAEKKRNQQFLVRQMEEEKQKAGQQRIDKGREQSAYWGPEEKRAQEQDVHKEHCEHLIKQMEVDQSRRLNSRGRRLRQERRLVDNSIAEMTQDREKEKLKAQRHRDVLTTTWESQQKIKQAIGTLEVM